VVRDYVPRTGKKQIRNSGTRSRGVPRTRKVRSLVAVEGHGTRKGDGRQGVRERRCKRKIGRGGQTGKNWKEVRTLENGRSTCPKKKPKKKNPPGKNRRTTSKKKPVKGRRGGVQRVGHYSL